MKQTVINNLFKNRLFYLILALSLYTIILLLFRINILPPGINKIEEHYLKLILGWRGIIRDPLNLAINIIRSIDYKFFQPIKSSYLILLPNIILGFLSVIEFSFLLIIWYGKRTAFFGSFIFASGTYFLHIARFANNDIEYLFGMVTLLLISSIFKYKLNQIILYLIALTLGILLLIPGFIWLELIVLFLIKANLIKAVSYLRKWYKKLMLLLVFLVPIGLLIKYFTIQSEHIIRWLGYDKNLGNNFVMIIQKIAAVFSNIFIYGPNQNYLWLGRVPILNIFETTMCLIGIYFYIKFFRSHRSIMLFSLLIVSALLVGIGNILSIAVIIPIMYIFIATGISYCLRTWLKHFPFNPIMRTFGYALVVITILISITFNLRSYFIAWSNSPVTKSSFNIHQ